MSVLRLPIIALMAIALAASGVASKARAQIPVTDVADITQDVVHQISNAIDQAVQYAALLNDLDQQLANAAVMGNIEELRTLASIYDTINQVRAFEDRLGAIGSQDFTLTTFRDDLFDAILAEQGVDLRVDDTAAVARLIAMGADPETIETFQEGYTRYTAYTDSVERRASALSRDKMAGEESNASIGNLRGRSQALTNNSVGASAQLNAEIALHELTQNERVISALAAMEVSRLEDDIRELDRQIATLQASDDDTAARQRIVSTPSANLPNSALVTP